MTLTYTCTGCGRGLDPDELAEHGHVCDDWWEDHGIYDELPKIAVDHQNGSQT